MQKQVEQLVALLAQQAEESRCREERMSQLLEQAVSWREASSVGKDGQAHASPEQVKFPASSAVAPRLSSSASLREFGAWRHKFRGYVALLEISALPLAQQKVSSRPCWTASG